MSNRRLPVSNIATVTTPNDDNDDTNIINQHINHTENDNDDGFRSAVMNLATPTTTAVVTDVAVVVVVDDDLHNNNNNNNNNNNIKINNDHHQQQLQQRQLQSHLRAMKLKPTSMTTLDDNHYKKDHDTMTTYTATTASLSTYQSSTTGDDDDTVDDFENDWNITTWGVSDRDTNTTTTTTTTRSSGNNQRVNSNIHRKTTIVVTDWTNLHDADIKPLPSGYICDPNTVATAPMPQMKAIVTRITDLLRSLSVVVSFTNTTEYGNPYAICEDWDGVRFHVILYKSTTTATTGSMQQPPKLLVEVRYTGGDSMMYQSKQYQSRVLEVVHHPQEVGAATPAASPTPIVLHSSTATTTATPGSTMPPIPSDPLFCIMTDREQQIQWYDSLKRRIGDRTVPNEQINTILERVEQYMSSSSSFHNVNEGLSILLNVTNPNQSGYRIAEAISHELLTGTTSITTKMTLSLGILQVWHSTSTTPPPVLNHRNEDNDDGVRRNDIVLNDYTLLALRVIGQAVNLLDEKAMMIFASNPSVSILKDERYNNNNDDDESLLYVLPSILLQHIVRAAEKPHVAYCATHILTRLCERVPTICSHVRSNNNEPQYRHAITTASVFGSSHHMALECASRRLLSIINSAITDTDNNTKAG